METAIRSDTSWRRRFLSGTAIPIYISILALLVTVIQQINDARRAPDLHIYIPDYTDIHIAVGNVSIAPTVTIVNDGTVPGSLSRISCSLSGGDAGFKVDMRAPTRHAPGANGVTTIVPLAALSLSPAEEATSKINCIPNFYVGAFKDKYDDLFDRSRREFIAAGAPDCKSIDRNNYIYSPDLTTELENLFDEMFFLKAGLFRFEIALHGNNDAIVATAASMMEISPAMIDRLISVRSDLKYGFGTMCLHSPAGSAKAPLTPIAG